VIFAGPGLNLGHPARPAVTSGLGVSAFLVIEFDELPQPAAQCKGKPVFTTERDRYPVRVLDLPIIGRARNSHPDRCS
jgi:hypothetical protein